MTEAQARELLAEAYTSRDDAATSCFGDCCLAPNEKEALLTLIYGATDARTG